MDEAGNYWTAASTALLTAERLRAPIPRLTTGSEALALDDAYRIQAATVAQRIASGACVVGHKVGVTSAAMQQQMGVAEPDSGALFDDAVLLDGSTLAHGDFLHPRVEAEIAFRLGRDLAGPDITLADARGAVVEVLLALEVIDSRYDTNWKISVADSIADNASCARVVRGTPVPLDPTWDLAAERLLILVNDVPAASGEGRAVLGDPFRPLVWLAQRLHELGTGVTGLRAGDLVLAGAVHASLPLDMHTTVRADSPHLPSVHLRVV